MGRWKKFVMIGITLLLVSGVLLITVLGGVLLALLLGAGAG